MDYDQGPNNNTDNNINNSMFNSQQNFPSPLLNGESMEALRQFLMQQDINYSSLFPFPSDAEGGPARTTNETTSLSFPPAMDSSEIMGSSLPLSRQQEPLNYSGNHNQIVQLQIPSRPPSSEVPVNSANNSFTAPWSGTNTSNSTSSGMDTSSGNGKDNSNNNSISDSSPPGSNSTNGNSARVADPQVAPTAAAAPRKEGNQGKPAMGPTLFGKRVDLQAMMNSPATRIQNTIKQGQLPQPTASSSVEAKPVAVPSFQPKRKFAGITFGYDAGDSSSMCSGNTGSSAASKRFMKPRQDDAFWGIAEQHHTAPPVSEDEGDRQRRRQDRNMREQQRCHQINFQIDDLRQILVAADLKFKPDKFSTLATVADYISLLQERQRELQHEHEQLLKTISGTAEFMAQQYGGVKATSSAAKPTLPEKSIETTSSSSICDTNVSLDDLVDRKIHVIDYKAVFSSCSLFGTGITSIDGRFVDCNKGFEETTGFSRHELLPPSGSGRVGEDGIERNLSLFNVLARQDMERVFISMSSMLRPQTWEGGNGSPPNNEEDQNHKPESDNWTTIVNLSRKPNQKVQLTLSLIRSTGHRPQLFNCTLIPQGYDGQALNATG